MLKRGLTRRQRLFGLGGISVSTFYGPGDHVSMTEMFICRRWCDRSRNLKVAVHQRSVVEHVVGAGDGTT